MEWMGALPLAIAGFALIIHGFPDINIGNTTNNYYDKDDKNKN